MISQFIIACTINNNTPDITTTNTFLNTHSFSGVYNNIDFLLPYCHSFLLTYIKSFDFCARAFFHLFSSPSPHLPVSVSLLSLSSRVGISAVAACLYNISLVLLIGEYQLGGSGRQCVINGCAARPGYLRLGAGCFTARGGDNCLKTPPLSRPTQRSPCK